MTGRQLLPRAPAGPDDVVTLLAELPSALDGSGPALALSAAGASPAGAPERLTQTEDEAHDPTALTVTTSGSSGPPRTVLLQASALLASAGAGHDRLGGPGRWLLALPAHHIAGVNVLVRSLVANRRPVLVDLTGGFDPGGFARACAELAELGGPRRYTALVPTQLGRLLDAGGEPLAAVAGLDAVLVGGAAISAPLRERAEAAGVRVVTSYGMSETCGGCVYDGQPLDGVEAALDEAGRVRLAGPMLARGYRDPATDGIDRAGGHFAHRDGQRWFVTDDVGHWAGPHDARRLVVDGRSDGAITTGGVTVSAAAVETALTELPGVAEAVVVGLPDPEWGQRLVAVLVAAPGCPTPELDLVRRHVGARLGAAAAPRELRVLAALPTRGPGKPDRAALAMLFGTSG